MASHCAETARIDGSAYTMRAPCLQAHAHHGDDAVVRHSAQGRPPQLHLQAS